MVNTDVVTKKSLTLSVAAYDYYSDEEITISPEDRDIDIPADELPAGCVSLEDLIKLTITYPSAALIRFIENEVISGALSVKTLAELFTVFNNRHLIQKSIRNMHNALQHLSIAPSSEGTTLAADIIDNLKGGDHTRYAAAHQTLCIMISQIKNTLMCLL